MPTVSVSCDGRGLSRSGLGPQSRLGVANGRTRSLRPKQREWIVGGVAVLALLGVAVPVRAQSSLAPPPERPILDGNGVDVVAQQFSYSLPLLAIGPSGNGGLEYSIYYSSMSMRDSFNNVHVVDGAGNNTFFMGNSSETIDSGGIGLGNGSYFSGTSYFQRDGTETAYTYALPGGGYRAAYIEYPNGVRSTFHYKTATIGGVDYVRLQSVTTNTGFQMKMNYQSNSLASAGPWLELASIAAINNAVEYCDPDADTCSLSSSWPQMQRSYSVLATAQVYQFQDAVGQTTQVSVGTGSSNNWVKIQTPDSSTDNLIYNYANVTTPAGTERRIVSADINGKLTTYTFAYSSPYQTITASAPLSQQYEYVTDWGEPVVSSVEDPLSRTTSFTYDTTYHRLLTATPPEGNYTEFQLDGGATDYRGNITQATLHPKTGSSTTPLSESWTFPATCVAPAITPKTCNKPTAHTDPKGQVITYTYDNNHGGVLTETGPADANGIQPVKRYAYTQHYPWIKDAMGSYVTGTPVWLLDSEKTCISTATVSGACAGGSSDELVISYDYGPNSGPNNLLLRGKVVTSNGTSLRTCYGYDPYGNKISETTPRAGLTSCP